MTLYPQTIRSKRTCGASSSNLALKRNQFSVFIETITHVSSISGSSPSVAEKRTFKALYD
jgi:hypothetical protein